MTEPAREIREITSTGAWLEWRKSDITASRVAALWDLNPYLSRDQLADIMRGTTAAGTGSIPDSPAMRRGRILEPAVAAAVEEERPEWAPLVKAHSYHRLPDLRLGCTPDYFVGDDGLVQCKTVSAQQFEAWRGKPPIFYVLQTLTELLVTGRSWGALACLVVSPSYPLHLYDVPRHAAAEQRILDAVAAWWKAWDAGDIAGPTASTDIEADLDDGSYIDLSADNELPSLLVERAMLKAASSTADKRIKDIDGTIKARLGPASTAWLPGWAISWRAQQRKEFTVPAATIRVLRVKASDDSDTDESAP